MYQLLSVRTSKPDVGDACIKRLGVRKKMLETSWIPRCDQNTPKVIANKHSIAIRGPEQIQIYLHLYWFGYLYWIEN